MPSKTSNSVALKGFLAGVEPFTKLPPAELDRLGTVGQEVKHTKGEFIFSEGESATSVWILKSGQLEIFKYTSQGKSHAIENIYPKELFGTLCRLGADGRNYPCTAMAAVDSVSIRIPDSVFLDQFRRYPLMVTGVCALCSSRLNMMQELTCTVQEPVEKRIVRTLIQLHKVHGEDLPFTKKQIAEMAGTTVETTIRTLSRYQKNNLISSTRGHISLKDIPKLQAILG